MSMTVNECVPGEILGEVSVDLPEGEHVWKVFFWQEGNCEARLCGRCLRLEWNKDGVFVETSEV